MSAVEDAAKVLGDHSPGRYFVAADGHRECYCGAVLAADESLCDHLVRMLAEAGLLRPDGDTRTELAAAILALHVCRDDAVYDIGCIEGDCDHVPIDFDGGEGPHPNCPKKADAVCAHCADQTNPGDAWEHMIRADAFWPCSTVRAVSPWVEVPS